jgi:hypothetical protein
VETVDRLLALASARLETAPVLGLPAGPRGAELAAILGRCTGFVAFDSALLVRGVGGGTLGLAAWNAATGWRSTFAGMADDVFFFAEDLFGCQWGIQDDDVVAFDPETGETVPFAETVEEWAGMVVDDRDYLTGHPTACDWQRAHGPLPLGHRLVPTVPFVLGGGYDVENLVAVDAYDGMRRRGRMAVQLKDIPDGAQVEYGVPD